MMKRTILFDLDGTLLDTLADLHASTNFALREYGYLERTLEEVRAFVGNGLRMLIVRCLPKGSNEAEIDRVLAAMKAHYAQHCCEKTAFYAGVPALLQALTDDGCKLAGVTNKAMQMAQVLHERFFAPWVTLTIGESSRLPKKPDPAMVREALSTLNGSKEDAVYVGDSDVDILTAKNAGLPCLSVSWGFRSANFLWDSGAKSVSATPEELYRAICAL